jgi:putative phage-type endonuclease
VTSQLGNARLLGAYEPGTPAWENARRARIGGSEVAALLGLSKWESPFSLWHRKAGLIGPQPTNPEMELGTLLEDDVCQLFERQYSDVWIVPTGTWVSTIHDYQILSPDRLVFLPTGEIRILEAKVADDEWEWGPAEAGADGIPPYYLTQVRWYLDGFGLQVAYLAVLFLRGRELRVYEIHADAEDAAYMREKAEAFLATVDAGEAPALDGHGATYQAVRDLHPDIDDRDHQLDPELAAEYRAACAAYDAAKADKQLQTTRVADAMGTARRAVVDKDVIARRQTKGDGVPHIVKAPIRKKAA